MIKICYYPGCTLKTQAKDLDKYARKSALALGVEMEEIENWQCCGAVYPTARDEIATKLSAIRALDYARNNGGKLLTLCSACHNDIKRVNHDMQCDDNIRTKANNYLALEQPYSGETQVVHYLEMLRDIVGFDKIAAAVKNPVKRKIGAYYGCLLLRPGNVMAFDNPENPSIIEDFLKALGATPVKYPMRNECCGAYVSFKDAELPRKRSGSVISSAVENGAEEIVTACPLCLYNLRKYSGGAVKITYFTELLAEALGVKDDE